MNDFESRLSIEAQDMRRAARLEDEDDGAPWMENAPWPEPAMLEADDDMVDDAYRRLVGRHKYARRYRE